MLIFLCCGVCSRASQSKMGNTAFDHDHIPTVLQPPVLWRHFLARPFRERGVYEIANSYVLGL